MRWALVIAVVLCGAAQGVAAKSSTVIGSSSAYLCYQASQLPLSLQGLSDCTDAIREDDLVMRDLAATYANRGIIYAANGRLEEAIEDYNEALELAPGIGRIYNNRGNAYHRLHDYEKALADYDKALALASGVRDTIYYNKALTLILMKRWDEARENLEAALEVNPNLRRAQRKLAQFEDPGESPGTSAVELENMPRPPKDEESADP